MSELYDRIVSERGTLERVLARLPGFGGYVDRAARRTADRMVRDYVAGEMAKAVQRLVQIERKLLDKTGLRYMSRTQSAKAKLQMYHDRIKAAAPGYSGFMEAIKIDSEELEKLYSFDEAQIRYADQFEDALRNLSDAIDADSDIDAAIEALDALTIEANEAFQLREDVLTGLSKSL